MNKTIFLFKYYDCETKTVCIKRIEFEKKDTLRRLTMIANDIAFDFLDELNESVVRYTYYSLELMLHY